ncbi:MAG: hypothetical protein KDD45_15845, partial [Bdellovibrionales bacterium]|nr:hypothetical protein [Bdellovibrionales bacterium]
MKKDTPFYYAKKHVKIIHLQYPNLFQSQLNIHRLKELLTVLGIKLVFLQKTGIIGRLETDNPNFKNVIYVNEQFVGVDRIRIIAHELGHW